MKVKLFTHTDLDGIGCAIIGRIAYDININIEYCDYHNVNEKVKDYINSRNYLEYDSTLITDISVDELTTDLINYAYSLGHKFQLLDHHPTAAWMNKYEWATVRPLHSENAKSSGTSMLYLYLSDNPNLFKASNFVEKVRRYDTWEWSTKYNDEHAKSLNDLLYLIGRDRFIERFCENQDIEFTDTEKTILEIENKKIENYIEKKSKQMFEDNLVNYRVGVVFAEQYQSQLGNALAKNNPHLDFIVLIDVGNNSVSYRGIHSHINIGEFVKTYGGGGHPQAAGSQTHEIVKKENWMDYIVYSKDFYGVNKL